MRVRVAIISMVVVVGLCACPMALAGVRHGWECIPKTAGKPVLSGGTGSDPQCHAGATAALAPTYVYLGPGGQPTAEFSEVNVQIDSGTGKTAGLLDGRGNLIIGYGENAYKRKRTGSNNLIVGINSGWTGYGDLIAGANDSANADYSTALGVFNSVRGRGSFAAGHGNVASGLGSSVTGGEFNLAADPFSSIAGGCDNLAGTGSTPMQKCSSTGIEAVLGGASNIAADQGASISGGCDDWTSSSAGQGAVGQPSAVCGDGGQGFEAITGGAVNVASGFGATVNGGTANTASGFGASVNGYTNTASGADSTVLGGYLNTASGNSTAVLGGSLNTLSGYCTSIPATPQHTTC